MTRNRSLVIAVVSGVGATLFAVAGLSVAALAEHVPPDGPNVVPAGPEATAPQTSGPTAPASTATNYQLAAAESEETLASFTPPPRSVKIDGSPAGWHGDVMAPQSDKTLSRTEWWKTPLTEAGVARYLSDESVSSVTPVETAHGSGSGPGYGFSTAMFEQPGYPVSQAFSAPVLSVAYESLGGATYIKVVSFETARYAVPNQFRITEPIVSVRVERTTTVYKNGQKQKVTKAPPAMLSGAANEQKIAALVSAYNSMPAGYTISMIYSCPAEPTTTTATTVTFVGDSGQVWIATTSPFACGFGFSVSTTGASFDHVLDGSTLFAALGRAVPPGPK